ncbi:MAG: hypothetical protein ACI3YC_08460 [Alloprevotella sp.]
MTNNNVRFDVMLEDKYLCTMVMPSILADDIRDGQPIFNMETFSRFVESRRPSLKNKPYRIAF